MSDACCAHSRVLHVPVRWPDGGYSDAWACTDCGLTFSPGEHRFATPPVDAVVARLVAGARHDAYVLAAERGAAHPDDGCQWTWGDWEWTGVLGGDEDHEPTTLYVRHRANWYEEAGDKPWAWFCVEQIGQGDEGDEVARGCSETAWGAMEAARMAAEEVRDA